MSYQPFKIAVVGTGYVGLVSGTCFADLGNDVICVDVDPEKIKRLDTGEITFYEPGLEAVFQRNICDKRLSFTLDLKQAVLGSDIIFLALPTPPGDDGSADLSYVIRVTEHIEQLLQKHKGKTGYKVIVTKSTVPVGTADRLTKIMQGNGLEPGVEFDIASNPEFLREGVAVDDFMKPDRIVLGSHSQKALNILTELYEPFSRQGTTIIQVDPRSSEMIKYAANSYLATKITYINEIANLCDKVGADVSMVRMGMGTDSRIGNDFLNAGIGFGGSCFPKDVQALKRTSDEQGYRFQIIDSVLEINRQQRIIPWLKLKEYFGDLHGRLIAIWGLAFKANTDDTREAAAGYIIEKLLEDGATVHVYDPEAMNNTRRQFGDRITYFDDCYDAIQHCDALCVCTEWNEFRKIDFDKMKKMMRGDFIIDGRNLYDPEVLKQYGFSVYNIGMNLKRTSMSRENL